MNPIKILSKLYFAKNTLPTWCVIAIDCICVMFAGFCSYYAVAGGSMIAGNFWKLFHTLLIGLVFYLISFYIFKTYRGIIRYSSFKDLLKVAEALTLGGILFRLFSYAVVRFSLPFIPFSWLSIIIIGFIGLSLMGMERIIVKVLYDSIRIGEHAENALIYGVKGGGMGLAKSIRSEEGDLQFRIKGFVNPNPEDAINMIAGIKVYNDDDDLIEWVKMLKIAVVIVSPLQTDHFREREPLINALIDAKVRIMMMPSVEEWDGKSDLHHKSLRNVDVEDLLPRDQISVDMNAIGSLLKGNRILITGAAGSIGSEMVRQVAKFSPAEMVLIDQAETPMHDVRRFMAVKYPNIKCETIVTSITKQDRMEMIFKEHTPDYVFHAAAYKHVPMMEDNPAEAIQNNVYGTRVIADLAVKYGTKKFVMISTDKAVNPTNVMGCSKRICEIYCQALNQAIVEGKVEGKTQFVTTRFGNVLGSNGSVIPIFKEQIAAGGPLTVTHPDIIRFFMLIPEACKLVLEAGTMGKGGEIFVFDMGKPVRIVDLAKRMIKLSGAKDVEIKFTGLRDGEKLYEEVLADAEETKPTIHPKIKIAAVREYDYETAQKNEERLLQASYSYDDMGIVRIMKEIVPEFKSKQSKYEALDKA